MPIRANALVVMAKAPIAGAVKTRLIPFLSAAEAAELARALLLDQLEHLSRVRIADLHLAFTPKQAVASMQQLAPAPFELFPQTDGDLGARMQNLFASLFVKGYKKIVLIGADLPPVPLAYFRQAFAYLAVGERRAVLGPSQDGGYYLVGLNRDLPAIFEGMIWSHDRVLADTLAKLASLGIATEQLPTWFDIDTPDDLQRLLRLKGSHESAMQHTWQVLDRLGSLAALVPKTPET